MAKHETTRLLQELEALTESVSNGLARYTSRTTSVDVLIRMISDWEKSINAKGAAFVGSMPLAGRKKRSSVANEQVDERELKEFAETRDEILANVKKLNGEIDEWKNSLTRDQVELKKLYEKLIKKLRSLTGKILPSAKTREKIQRVFEAIESTFSLIRKLDEYTEAYPSLIKPSTIKPKSLMTTDLPK